MKVHLRAAYYFLLMMGVFSSDDTAFAQRETFEASVIRRKERIAEQLKVPSVSAEATVIVVRIGVGVDGQQKEIKAGKEAVSFDNILFDLDSATIRPGDSIRQLEEIADALMDSALEKEHFLVEGHTCDLGDRDHNLKLSVARAETVRRALIDKGIAAERIAVLGCGELEPIKELPVAASPGEMEKARATNRRVVIRRLPSP